MKIPDFRDRKFQSQLVDPLAGTGLFSRMALDSPACELSAHQSARKGCRMRSLRQMIQDHDLKSPVTQTAPLRPAQAATSPHVRSSTLTLDGTLMSDGRITVAGTVEGVMAVTRLEADRLVSDTSRFQATVSGTLESDSVWISGGGQFRARLNCTSMHADDMIGEPGPGTEQAATLPRPPGLRRSAWNLARGSGPDLWSLAPLFAGVVLGFCAALQISPWFAGGVRHSRDTIEISGPPAPDWAMLLQTPLRLDVEQALARMTDPELVATYADINVAFQGFLDTSHPGAARTLLDYAFLADRALAARQLSRPEGTPSALEMLRQFDALF
jgi:hypothetical protein